MENMLEQIGNSSLKQYWEAGRKEVKSAPVPGLPRNWYNDDWFQGLTVGARSMLSVQKDIAIPGLVSSICIVFNAQFMPHTGALQRSLTVIRRWHSQGTTAWPT